MFGCMYNAQGEIKLMVSNDICNDVRRSLRSSKVFVGPLVEIFMYRSLIKFAPRFLTIILFAFLSTQEYIPLDSSPNIGRSAAFVKGRQHMVLLFSVIHLQKLPICGIFL